MAKTEMIRARIEPEIKQAVEALLAEAGMTHSEFVGMVYRHACKTRSLPIEVKPTSAFKAWLESRPISKNIPNAETRRAMRQGTKGSKRYTDFQEMLDELKRER